MQGHGLAAVVVCAFTLVAVPASAQESTPGPTKDARPVEITPFVAIGSNGTSPVGTAVAFPIASKLSLETDVAYRPGEGHIHALSTNASLLWFLPRVGSATPYVAGGLGLAQYGSPVYGPAAQAPIGTQSRLAMTVNAGGGLKMPVSKTVDWRTDARWFKSLGREGTEHIRVSQGLSFDVGKR